MQGPKWPLFYSRLDPVWSLCMVGIGYVLWVELLVQSRLCSSYKTFPELFPNNFNMGYNPYTTQTPRFFRVCSKP